MAPAVRVFVSGGAGFLGRWFVRNHVEAGDEVIAVDDMSGAGATWWEPVGTSDIEDLPYVYLQDDLGAALAVPLAEEQFDLAYHFAAPVGGRVKIEGDPLFNADSLRLDSQFFRWAVSRVGTAIYPSSSAVYPVVFQGDRAQQLQEGMFNASNPNWLAPDEMYGFTKLVGERLAYVAERYGLNTLCIRPFSGYGEGQSDEYPVPSIVRRALNREDPLVVWGPGSQRRDFIHVEDIVGATLARLEAGVKGYETMNIGTGFGHSFDAVAKAAARVVGYEPEITHDETKPVGVQHRFADTSRMRKLYEPKVTLAEGLARVAESMQ